MTARAGVGISLVWTAAGAWSRELINFAVFMLLSRILGPESYGVMAMVTVFTAISAAVLVDSTSTYITRASRLEPEHIEACFWLEVALAVVLAAIIATAAPFLAELYHEPLVARLLPAMALLPLFYACSSTPTALLRRQMRFGPIATRQLLASAVGGVVGITLAKLGWGVWSLALMMLTQAGVAIAVTWSATDWRPRLALSLPHLKELRSFSANMIVTRLTTILDQQVPRLVIGVDLGKAALGFFTMAWRILEVSSQLTTMPIGQVAVPTLGRVQGDRVQMRERLLAFLELSLGVALPCFVGLATVAPVLIPTVLGPRWEGGVPLLQLFCAYGVGWAIITAGDPALVALGIMRVRTAVTWTGLGLLVLVLGLWLWLVGPPTLEQVGMLIVGRELFYALLYMALLGRHGLIDWAGLARIVAPLLLAASAMAFVVTGLEALTADHLIPGLIRLSVMIGGGAMVYGAALMVVARQRTLLMAKRILALRKPGA